VRGILNRLGADPAVAVEYTGKGDGPKTTLSARLRPSDRPAVVKDDGDPDAWRSAHAST
jgi:hypothetical protein